MEERGENTLGHVVPNHLIGVRGAEVAAESCWQTPHGTFGCGQAEKALLRTRHFDVLGKGMALFPARPTQPGLSHLEATLSVQGKGRSKSSISGGDRVSLQLGGLQQHNKTPRGDPDLQRISRYLYVGTVSLQLCVPAFGARPPGGSLPCDLQGVRAPASWTYSPTTFQREAQINRLKGAR
jgi:hypothetical protein